VRGQIGWRCGRAALGKVGWRAADDEVERRPPRAYTMVPSRAGAGANADIVASGDHVAHRVVEMQLQLDGGVETAEGWNERQDIGAAERRQ
jgi:hypothetical protein